MAVRLTRLGPTTQKDHKKRSHGSVSRSVGVFVPGTQRSAAFSWRTPVATNVTRRARIYNPPTGILSID